MIKFNPEDIVYRFFAENTDSEEFTLDESESRHCARVLRKKSGDEILVTNGKGMCVRAGILSVRSKAVDLRRIEVVEQREPDEIQIWIAFAPTKNSKRYEWMLEKATEAGANGFVPLFCDHRERDKLNFRRCRDILLSAVKQSERLFLPEITDWMKVEQASAYFEEKGAVCQFLTAQDAGEHMTNLAPVSGLQVAYIGPEGDFSKGELALMHQKGFKYVNLGAHRLRTETAGLVATVFLSGTRYIKQRTV